MYKGYQVVNFTCIERASVGRCAHGDLGFGGGGGCGVAEAAVRKICNAQTYPVVADIC